MKFSTIAPELLELGYSPIPVVPGEKRPAIRAWSQYCTYPPFSHEITYWSMRYPDHSTGLTCGAASQIWALDIDANDHADAARIEQMADQFIGSTPLVRVGRHPRSLRVYKSVEPVKSVKGGLLDVLGAGRQFVAFGLHNQTRRPYEWLDESPLNYEATALPTINLEALRALLSALKEEFGTTGHQTDKSSVSRSMSLSGPSDLSEQRRGHRGQSRYKVLAKQLEAARPGRFHDTMVSVVAALSVLNMRPENIHRFFQHHFAAPTDGEYAEVWQQIDPAIKGAQKYAQRKH